METEEGLVNISSLEVCGLKVNTRQVLSSWGLRLCLKGIVEVAAHVRLS